MRHLRRALTVALVSAASAAVTGCNNEADPAETQGAVQADPNIMLGPLGNDASTMEAVGQLPLADPMSEEANASTNSGGNDNGDQPVLGETEGGDTGGNVIQGNVSGQ